MGKKDAYEEEEEEDEEYGTYMMQLEFLSQWCAAELMEYILTEKMEEFIDDHRKEWEEYRKLNTRLRWDEIKRKTGIEEKEHGN